MSRAERWRCVDRLLQEALDLPEEELAAYLARESGGDESVVQEVRELLRADREASALWDASAPDASAEPSRHRVPAGERIGAYRLEGVLGHGGMGTVYLAHRADGAFSRRVALKVMHAGAGSDEWRRRFRVERQVLARLEHPLIARLLDGGTTPDGYPYLVMEMVDGRPIDRFCREEGLSVRERVALVRKVCQAVAWAHRHLVVHRDLKPSNVLVTPEGEPRLVDFGIAKLLEPDALDLTVEDTRTLLRAMSPAYASPEQVAGDPVTTVSDIYSLGVLLYLLFTGRLPCMGGRDAADVAALRRDLSGDLCTVVLKALEPEPRDRYESVEQLSADLERYLEDRPVLARRPSRVRRAVKFVHRNSLAVGAATLALLAVLAASGVSVVQRHRAEQEQARAEEVTRLLVESFVLADPLRAGGNEVTVRQALDRASNRLVHLEDPGLRTTLLHTFGTVYHGLGSYSAAAERLEGALEQRRRLHGERSAEVAETLRALGLVRVDAGDYEGAEPLLERALEIERELFGPAHPRVAAVLRELGYLLEGRGRHEEAQSRYRESLAIRRARLGAESEEVASSLGDLARSLQYSGDLDAAEPLLRESLRLRRKLHGDRHPSVSTALNDLAVVLLQRGDYAEAETRFREILELDRELLGPSHPYVATTVHNLAGALSYQGEYTEAEELYREALAMRRALLGPRHPDVGVTLNDLASLLRENRDPTAAAEAYREALEILRGHFGDRHPNVAVALLNLSTVLEETGDLDRASELCERALDLLRDLLGEAHPAAGRALVVLGRLALADSRATDAEARARESLDVYAANAPQSERFVAEARALLGASLAAQGLYERGEIELLAGLEGLSRSRGAHAFSTRWALRQVGALYLAREGGK